MAYQELDGTDFDPCVACLLDALAKLDSGALLVNVTVDLPDHSPSLVHHHHQKDYSTISNRR